MEKYDVIIIGTGPAGMSAAVYAARYNMKTLVFGQIIGGLINEAHRVCNLITYKEISGFDLGMKMKEHVENLGIEIKPEKIIDVSKKNDLFEIKSDLDTYYAKKIVLATGTKRRRLGLKNESNFVGKGVSYCATCDAAFYKDKIVSVIGGGDSALTAAFLLAQFAKKVYIVYRKDKFAKAEPANVDEVEKSDKIKCIFNSNVVELIGDKKIEKIKLDSGKELKLDGVFVEVGSDPSIELAKKLGVKLEEGYIKVDNKQKTSVSGVFACGDVTSRPFKQVVTAFARGAIATYAAFEEIRRKE